MNYDISKIHGKSEYFDASKLSEKPQLGLYRSKLLNQKALTPAEKKELGQILRSARKAESSSAHLSPVSDKQIIQHYRAELRGPDAAKQDRMSSAASQVFSHAVSSKLQSKAVRASLVQGDRLRMEGIHDAEFDLDIEAVEELDPGDRVPSRTLGEDRLEFIVKGGDGSLKRVTLSADQMADKLLIKKEKLMKAAREGTLNALFASKKGQLEALPQIVASYQEVFESYSKVKRSNALKPAQLMKIVKSYYKADVGSVFNKKRAWKEGEAVLLKFTKENTGMKGMAFMARLEGGKMKLARFDLDKFLGAGTFGSAYKVEQLDAGRQMVLKLANRTFYLSHWAKKDIKNEYAILKDIHRNGTIPGIQEAPHAFFHISGAMDRVGFVGQKYDGDVADLVSDPFNDHKHIELAVLYKSCSEILGASPELHQRDIVHGDNKPANTFFISVRDKTGKITEVKAYLADFGGARKLEDIKNFDSGVTTSEYDPPGDRQWRRAARKAGDKEEFGKALKARDVYQRGVVLYQLLAGDHEPWETDSNRTLKHPPAHPDARFNEEPLRKRGVPQEMIDQLKAMMDPDPKKRPDADKAKKNWDNRVFKLGSA